MVKKRTADLKWAVTLLVICSLFLLLCPASRAQSNTAAPNSTKDKSSSLFAFPLVFFAPETSWGFGGAAINTFDLPESYHSSRPSQVQLLVAYTLKNQLLLFSPFDLYINDNTYRVTGEVGYYIFSYPFYGLGNNTPENNEEFYDVDFPRLIISGTRRILPGFYAGLRYWLDGYNITSVEQGQLLDTNPISGREGGFNSGLALLSSYDSRDNIFYSKSGIFIQYILHTDQPWLGSDFSFVQTSIDLRSFHSNSWNHTIGLNLFGQFSSEDTPFYRLPLLGGAKRMRGFIEGRFRDRHYLTFQTEYRIPVYKRWGTVVFGSIGQVASSVGDFNTGNIKPAGGLGLRYQLDEEQRLNLRLDYGFSETGSAFYVTFSEAF